MKSSVIDSKSSGNSTLPQSASSTFRPVKHKRTRSLATASTTQSQSTNFVLPDSKRTDGFKNKILMTIQSPSMEKIVRQQQSESKQSGGSITPSLLARTMSPKAFNERNIISPSFDYSKAPPTRETLRSISQTPISARADSRLGKSGGQLLQFGHQLQSLSRQSSQAKIDNHKVLEENANTQELETLRKKVIEQEIELEKYKHRPEDKSTTKIHNQSEFRSTFNNPYLFLDHDAVKSLDFQELEKDDAQTVKRVHLSLVYKAFETYKTLKERVSLVSKLSDSLEPGIIKGINESDFLRLKNTIDNLVNTLVEVSKTELELGLKMRELTKRSHELNKKKADFEKLNETYKMCLSELNEANRARKELHQKITLQEKQFEIFKAESQEIRKKAEVFEKRLQLLLEVDFPGSNDKIRIALAELVKENDNQKRNIMNKAKEIFKQKEEVNRLKVKLQRQNRKIDSLTKSKKGFSNPDEEFNVNNLLNADLNLLSQTEIPSNLDFRLSSFRQQYVEMLSDILDQGAVSFVNSLEEIEQHRVRREAIVFATNQLINYKDFSERQHIFFKQLTNLVKVSSIEQLMTEVNKNFKPTFNCDSIHLWIPDGLTGIFYTTDAKEGVIRCVSSKGLISEVIRHKRAYNKRNMKNQFFSETTSPQGKYEVDNTLVIPIKLQQNKICAILEISDIIDTHFGFDEEYFGLGLTQIITEIMRRLFNTTSLSKQNKMRGTILESFADLLQANSLCHFSELTQKWAFRIFGVSTSRLIIVEGSNFLIFKSQDKVEKHSTSMGISGKAFLQKAPVIAPDVGTSKEYNQFVDMKSVMPTFVVPLLDQHHDIKTAEVLGIFQIVIKPKTQTQMDFEDRIIDEETLNSIGHDDSFQTLVEIFAQIASRALQFVKQSVKKQ